MLHTRFLMVHPISLLTSPFLLQGVLMILGQADTSWNNMKKFLVRFLSRGC